ncbi:MAG TPA: GatB/YqeY domain-containing protein [Bacteroidales bacterium]|nr:GatB/YqeY domain-containing protein [Bacteroidales bacterium]
MSYAEKINDDLKQAMKEKQKDRLEALRAVKTAFTLARSSKGAGSVLTEDEEIKLMQKLVKQRHESAVIYKEQGREELADNELREATFIEAYLRKLVDETGATGMKDMGMVMGRATKELAGKADGKTVSGIVRKLLS